MIADHFTKSPNVYWYFDSVEKQLSTFYKVVGWIVVMDEGQFKPVTSICVDGVTIPFNVIDRPDVLKYYPGTNSNVGVEFIVRQGSNIDISLGELTYHCGNIDNYIAFYSGFANEHKSLIVVDNFYDNPDFIRNYAINNLDYNPSEYHKGKRSTKKFILEGTKEKFEQIIGRKIINWNYEEYANGVFQYCVASDPIVHHIDAQTYAAIVFLTKDAPYETGTTFYASKFTGRTRFDDTTKDIEAYEKTFKGRNSELNFYDSTQYEKIDEIGNLYNRLVIFDAKRIHAASKYFGDRIDNARLFHLFFFDVK